MMSSRLLAFQMSGGPPYGLRLQGGDGTPFIIAKIRPASKAEAVGLLEGDVLVAVNGVQCRGLSHSTTTSLMDLNDSLLTVHVLRGPGAMGDVASAERSMGSQLTVLSEADASALVGNNKPSVIVATQDTPGLYNTPAFGDIQLMAAPVGRNADGSLGSQPGGSYSRNEQTFNDGGRERKVIEEKETKKYGGTTMTTVTRKEFSTYSSSGDGNYQPRQDPLIRSVQDESFGVRGQPDWFGERREDRTQYSVSSSQPRQQAQPSSALEYTYTLGGSPYSDTDPSRFGGGFDRQPQPAPAITQSWQQQAPANNPNVRTYYEGDIKPGQNVVMPGFTISIEAPRQGGQTAGPQPIVTVTPADSDGHVMVTPSRWQEQTPSQPSWQSAQVPAASNFRVATGPSQVYRTADDDLHQQYGAQQVRTDFQQSEQQQVSEGQWHNAPIDRSWNNTVEVGKRLEGMGLRDWKNEETSSQQQQQMYAAPSRVENVMVTVGNTPNYTYKPVVQQEPEGPFYATTPTKPYTVNQQPAMQRSNNPPQRSQSIQNHTAEPQYYEQGPTFPYNARGIIPRNEPPQQQQQQPQPPSWSSTYQPQNQASPAARYQQQSQPQSPPPADPKHNLYLPRSNQASSSTPDMNESNYYGSSQAHAAPMNRSSSYPAGFSQQPPPQPPAPQYTSPAFTPRTSQIPYQANQYQNEPQTAPVKPSFKLPLNPHFNKSIFGNESAGSPTAAEMQDSAPAAFNQTTYFGQQATLRGQGQTGSPPAIYGDMQYNPQANVPPQNDGYNYGGGPPTSNMWSPPAMQKGNPQMSPWQGQGGYVPGPGDRQQYMEQNAGDGGYYNPAAMIPAPPPISQMPPGGIISPSAPAGPPPPVAPPLPENPFKVYGIVSSSADPERRNLENKVKLANSVAHAVMSPENGNSRGQKMFLRRQQNSHKWTTSGPDPVEQQQDSRQQPSWAAAAPSRQGQPPQGMSRSPQAEWQNPMMDSGDVGGGRGGALFAKIRQRSESAERAAAERQWQSGGPRQAQPGGFSQQQNYQGMNQQWSQPPVAPMSQFRSQPTLASNQFGGVSDL